jgi:6-phosphofructokinase
MISTGDIRSISEKGAVEVMGRDAGLIALRSGIGAGAEAILIPETKTDLNHLIERLKKSRKGKSSKIIIIITTVMVIMIMIISTSQIMI